VGRNSQDPENVHGTKETCMVRTVTKCFSRNTAAS
jgi:hypothetical protein